MHAYSHYIPHTSSCACSHYIPHTTSRVCWIIIHIPARVCLLNFNRPHGLNSFNRPHGTFGPCTRGEKGRTMCTSLSHMGCIGAVTTALFFGLTRPRQRAITTAHPTSSIYTCGSVGAVTTAHPTAGHEDRFQFALPLHVPECVLKQMCCGRKTLFSSRLSRRANIVDTVLDRIDNGEFSCSLALSTQMPLGRPRVEVRLLSSVGRPRVGRSERAERPRFRRRPQETLSKVAGVEREAHSLPTSSAQVAAC